VHPPNRLALTRGGPSAAERLFDSTLDITLRGDSDIPIYIALPGRRLWGGDSRYRQRPRSNRKPEMMNRCNLNRWCNVGNTGRCSMSFGSREERWLGKMGKPGRCLRTIPSGKEAMGGSSRWLIRQLRRHHPNPRPAYRLYHSYSRRLRDRLSWLPRYRRRESQARSRRKQQPQHLEHICESSMYPTMSIERVGVHLRAAVRGRPSCNGMFDGEGIRTQALPPHRPPNDVT
jgi:hypothetical protein